jgi:hypothetical protein
MTGEPWPGVVVGGRPEVEALADFLLAKPGAEDLVDRPHRHWSSFSMRRVTRKRWHEITNDGLNR